jgi:RND family efflux transporter MFP subunit
MDTSQRPNCIPWLLLSFAVIVGCERAKSEVVTAAKPPEAYYLLPVAKQVVDHEDFTGHTQAIKTVTVRARVSGYLVKVNFIDGAHVNEGNVLFEIDSRLYQADYDRLQATVVQNQRHTARTQQDLDRADKLIGSKAISQEQYDQYLFDNLESKAALKSAEAALETASLNLAFTKVTSPVTGRVSNRMVDPGNLVVADNTPLTTIVSEDPVWAYFDIDEHTSLRIQRLDDKTQIKSQHAADKVVYLGLVDEKGFPHKGTIDFVDNQVDTQTGTLRLRGVFSNTDGLLTPGLFVRIRLPIGEPHDALIIPERALQTDQGRKFVYVVNADNGVEYRGVTVGDIFSEGTRIVEAGLKPEDRVIVSGLQRVKPGVKVEAKLETIEAAEPGSRPTGTPMDQRQPVKGSSGSDNSGPAGAPAAANKNPTLPAYGTGGISSPQPGSLQNAAAPPGPALYGPANPSNSSPAPPGATPRGARSYGAEPSDSRINSK